MTPRVEKKQLLSTDDVGPSGSGVFIQFLLGFTMLVVVMVSGQGFVAEEAAAAITSAGDVTKSSHYTDAIKTLDEARKVWVRSTLHQDYGKDNFEKIFFDKDGKLLSFEPVSEDGISTIRLRRKLQIRLLQHHIEGKARFVWATGGHSAAAGHGNLYNESYTAVLERDLLQVFPKIGLDFEARNYAMGGQASGPEIGLCVEQIFGNDIDTLSWDFQMTDVYHPLRLLLYTYRANLLANHPPVFTIRGTREGRIDLLKGSQKNGITAFYLPDEVIKAQKEGIPGITLDNAKEIDKMPSMVRAFKCGNDLEKGDLGCDDAKYSKEICGDRAGKASWHPGFKSHALDGHTIALFMVQELRDAIKDLAILLEGYGSSNHNNRTLRRRRLYKENTKPETLLRKLQREERDLFESFQKADVPEAALTIHRWLKCINGGNNDDEKKLVEDECDQDPDFEMLISTFYKGPGICHTALLPSDTRYKGYLVDDTSKTGGPVPFGQETYEVGVFRDKADENPEPTIRLISEEKSKIQEECPAVVAPDYKDFFYANEQDGPAKLRVPTSAEKEAYSYDPSRFQGIIGIQFIVCPYGKCPAGNIGQNRDFLDGKFEITVNGLPVRSLITFHSPGCYFLKGDDGYKWKSDPDSGDFELSVHIKEKNSYVRFSSIILY